MERRQPLVVQERMPTAELLVPQCVWLSNQQEQEALVQRVPSTCAVEGDRLQRVRDHVRARPQVFRSTRVQASSEHVVTTAQREVQAT